MFSYVSQINLFCFIPTEGSNLFQKEVTRYEIRQLLKTEGKFGNEGKRFFEAVEKMMENEKDSDGNEIPGTSNFFRIAGYHGEPMGAKFSHLGDFVNDYCPHSRESFPGWHRIYLWEFEQYLQKADQDLGRDGNIGMPFWYVQYTYALYTHYITYTHILKGLDGYDTRQGR